MPLVRRVLDGDREALDALLKKVAPAVLRATRSVLGADHPDVEDALQEGLLRFANSLGRYQAKSTVLHYAVRIATHAAIDAVRKSEQRHRIRDALSKEQQSQMSTTSTARALVVQEALSRLLEELSAVQSEALIMKVALGYSVDEIAAATEVPRNTVRSRLGHARRVLRERIERDTELARILRDMQ
ncbi:MAG: sigma-70 family RNA polymerase sigma factor [Myxococcota bacterium]